MASTTASPSNTLDDRELARLALAGDGQAFAALYDRHERRVFGFCLRMLGSEDEAAEATQETFMRLLRRLPALRERDLNFIAYALATARNACYDAIEARRRVEPVGELERLEPRRPEPGEISLDPERSALLAATRAQVQAANAALSERQREVLALRELEQLSYEQIGEIVGLNDNAVAQLISRARIKLRDLLRGGALESLAASSPECERALPLLARLQDAQDGASEELAWAQAHLTGCQTCRLSRAAMEEAGHSYRALGPIVALVWLRHTTIARAAELVGADWGHLLNGGARHAARRPHEAGPRLGARRLPGAGRGLGRQRVRWLLGMGTLGVCVIAAIALTGSISPDRPVLSLQAPGVSGVAATSQHATARPAARPVDPAVRAKRASNSAARSAQSGYAALAQGASVGIVVPNVEGSVPHGTAPRHASAPTSKRHATRHTSPSPPTPPPAGAPAPPSGSTTPTSTTPAASPPSGEPSSGSGSGTSTTPAETTTTGPSPNGSGSTGGSTGAGSEGGHNCTFAAIAC